MAEETKWRIPPGGMLAGLDMSPTTNPSAKAAQQIWDLIDAHMKGPKFSSPIIHMHQIQAIVDSALSDSLRPYRELLEEAIMMIPSDESTDNWHRAVDQLIGEK